MKHQPPGTGQRECCGNQTEYRYQAKERDACRPAQSLAEPQGGLGPNVNQLKARNSFSRSLPAANVKCRLVGNWHQEQCCCKDEPHLQGWRQHASGSNIAVESKGKTSRDAKNKVERYRQEGVNEEGQEARRPPCRQKFGHCWSIRFRACELGNYRMAVLSQRGFQSVVSCRNSLKPRRSSIRGTWLVKHKRIRHLVVPCLLMRFVRRPHEP